MKKIIRLGLAFLIISFMVVSFQKFDCAAAVKTINVSKTEASVPTFLAVPHLQKKASTSQLFSFLKDSPDVIASGISGTCKWEITADGILTIDKGQLATGTVPINEYYPSGSNWTANGNGEKIKKVDIKPGVSLPKDATAVFANLPNVTEIEGLENLDTSETTNMSHLFDGCYKLTSINVSNFDTGKVTDMSFMFKQCSNITSLDVSSFDTSRVTNMSQMFIGCSATTLDLRNFNTSQVTNMSNMFSHCTNLQSINTSSFNTSQVTTMQSMYNSCSVPTLDVSNFDTSKVTNMNSIFLSMNHTWKLTLGKNFELKCDSDYRAWPNKDTPYINDTFYDGKLKYTTINSKNSNERADFEWREVGNGNPHDPKDPKGKIYKPYDNLNPIATNGNQLNSIITDINNAAKNKTPITFVWNNEPYNAPPSLVFTDSDQKPIISDDSLRSDKPYTYSYDFRDKDKDFPPLNIYGTLRDEDSSQVTLSYWIDDNSTNKKEVKTVDTTSSNGEENKTRVHWSFAITDQDDLKALATPKPKGGGHTIHVEARDNGTDQDVYFPASVTFKAPVAENAIVQFNYQDSSGKPLRDSQTLVRPVPPQRYATPGDNTYGYDVKKYLPQYIWLKDNNNHLLRYGISQYNYLLNNVWTKWGNFFYNGRGCLASTASEEDLVKKVTLTYDDIGQISFLQVPDLNFGSRIRQATPRKYGLQYSSDKPPKLIVQDTTDSKSWTLYLSITKFINTKDPSKTLDGIFYYDNTPVSSGSEATIAEGGDFNPNTDHIYSISNSWYSDGKQQKDKGPWLNLQDQQPAVGTYQATATWTLKDTPQ